MTALLTVAEAAERLRVSPRTVQRLHQRRALPYVRFSGQVRFPAEALDRWIEQQIVYPEAGEPRPERKPCTEKKEVRIGGSPTAMPAGARLSAVLTLPTAPKPR